MNDKRWRWRRWAIVLLPLLLLSVLYEYAVSSPAKARETLVMPEDACMKDGSLVTHKGGWPKYVYNQTYGWFDTSHFGTGDPAQVIADVRTAVARGGGIVTIIQGIRDNITGYEAYYWVSGEVSEQEILGVAFGIYTDWSWRFEAWQARPPLSLVNPLTPFAIEDLPSQYLGFFAAAHNLTYQQVFACYLGGVKAFATSADPPHFLFGDDVTDEDALEVQRLANESFEPLVKTASGWRHQSWPKEMRLTAVPPTLTTWSFLEETSWYFVAE
jgi:hypothetical protein